MKISNLKTNSNRLNQMDFLRGLSAISIVLLHITAEILLNNNSATPLYSFGVLLNQITRFALPLFIILSGMGLSISKKIYNNFFEFLLVRFKKLFIQYVLCSLMYLFLFKGVQNLSLLSIIAAILKGNAFYHLYFIPLIFQFYFLYPFIKKYMNSGKIVILAFIATFGLQYVYNYVKYPEFLSFLFDRRFIFIWFFYFLFGIWISQHIRYIIEKISKYKYLLFFCSIISVILLTIQGLWKIQAGLAPNNALLSARPEVLFYTLFVFFSAFSINFSENFILKFNIISNLSYPLFLIHPFVIEIFKKIYLNYNHNYDFKYIFIGFSTVFLITFILAILLNLFVNKITSISLLSKLRDQKVKNET